MVISSCIHVERKKIRKEEERAGKSGDKISMIAEEEKRYGGGGEEKVGGTQTIPFTIEEDNFK